MNENGPLTEVITAYLQAVDAGQTPDQDEILARHPDLTVELRRFFATQDRLNNMAEPFQPEPPVVPSQRRSRVRRWAVGVVALCIVGLGLFGGYRGWQWLSHEPVSPQESDPEQLFRAMEEKISAADALEVAINGRLEVTRVVDGTNVMVATEFQASLLWADGNRGRFEFTATLVDQVMEFKMISDGTRMKEWQKPPGKENVSDTEKYLNDHSSGVLRYTGVGSMIFFARGKGGFIPRNKKSDVWFHVSEFKLGARETVGLRQGQGIEYKVSLPDGRTLPVQLWIDTETLLPLKRVVAGRVGTDDLQVIETYRELRLDPSIDAERFQLPK